MILRKVLKDDVSEASFLDGVNARNLPQANLVEQKARYINDHFPEYAANIVARADLALSGQLMLHGTNAQPYFVGNPPDWFTNPVNDNEFVWGLNRMVHWRDLLWAYHLTHEKKYADKVIQELLNWVQACPLPELTPQHFNLVDPWRSLEVGIRMFETWPWILTHLAGSEWLTSEVLAAYAISLHEHAEVLAEISPIYWPKADHNHYLMEMLGLLSLSCALPELRKAEVWRTFAMQELERCAAAQIVVDGGQIEGCPSYHNSCVYWFGLAILIAQRNNLSFSPEYIQRVRSMITYSLYATRPTGNCVPWGDSDADTLGVRAAILFGYETFHEDLPLEVMVSLAGKEAIIQTVLENIHEFKNPQLLFAKLAAMDPKPVSLPLINWQKGLDQVMLRTSWEPDALSVFFTCRSPINNAHAHQDPMGFDLSAFGKPLVVDPGRFTYREDEDRRKFKSATWHNTLMVDNREPFEYISSWRYGPQKKGQILRVVKNESLMEVEAIHHNYDPVVHRRVLAVLDKKWILILDEVSYLEPGQTVQLYYHLDSPHVNLFVNSQYAVTDDPIANVKILVSSNLECQLLDGRVSDKMDISRPSTRLRCEDRSESGSKRAYATLILPFKTGENPPSISSLELNSQGMGWKCSCWVNGIFYQYNWYSQTKIDD